MPKAPPAEKLPLPYAVGQAVRITDALSSHGDEVVEVLEIDTEEGNVRTKHGWYTPQQVEPAASVALDEIEAEIDGKKARVVFDGKTGAPQQELVHQSLEQIAMNIANKQDELDVALSEAGRARKRVQDLQNEKEAMVAELIAVRRGDEPGLFGEDDAE